MVGYAEVGEIQPSASERWQGLAFREELRRWVAGVVGEPTSLEPVKVRPWATVWRAETETGVLYAKQNCAGQAFEAALVVALNDLAARHVVPLAGVDLGRGLFLTPDQGEPLGDGTVEDWCRVVAAGAQLQFEVSRYADHLVDAGLTVLAPADCPAYTARRLGELTLPAPPPATLDDVERWADRVGALGLPLTLCHNDLHGRNVFDRDGELRFFDFADALVTEPLAALLVPLNVLMHQLGCAPDDPRLRRVADAALEVWTEHAPLAELRGVLPAALQLARLARVESWIRCTAPMTTAERAEWGGAPEAWLATLGEPPPGA
ncbi:phosphotransferase [Nocardioides pyridinolyticus]